MSSELIGASHGPHEYEWDVSDRLRKAREVAGLEQQQLAERMQVSRQTIGNYENRRVRLNRGFIALWSLATGAPLEWVLTGEWPGETPGGPAANIERGARSSTDRASDYGSTMRLHRRPFLNKVA